MNLIWDADPILFTVGGFPVGWYGVLFGLGFLLSQRVMYLVYRREGKVVLDVLLLYLMAGCIIGARITHCLFYDPAYYLSHPLSILRVWEGGLASHGAALGMIAALYLFSRRHPDHHFLWLIDRIAIVALMTGALVRVGNFINGEIVGTPTHSGFGVVFVPQSRVAVLRGFPSVRELHVTRREDDRSAPPGNIPVTMTLDMDLQRTPKELAFWYLTHTLLPAIQWNAVVKGTFTGLTGAGSVPVLTPLAGGWRAEIPAWGIARHPVQLYEGLSALLLAIGLFIVWWRRKAATPGGSLLGWCFILLFTIRFFLEFMKEDVTPIESGLPLKVGQMLSIPFVLLGIWMVRRARSPETTVSTSP
jgi:prolipoprotein diacylglyceryltransferase